VKRAKFRISLQLSNVSTLHLRTKGSSKQIPGTVCRIRTVQMLMAKCAWSDALVTGSSVAVY
jgi:hypothetical protein